MRFGAMGDILLTTPALAALRKKWPTTKIIYATKELYVDLIRTHSAINEIIALKEDESINQFMQRLQSLQVDYVLDLHDKTRTKILRQIVPKERRIIWQKRSGFEAFWVRLLLQTHRPKMHISQRFHQTVEKLTGSTLAREAMSYAVDPISRDFISSDLQKNGFDPQNKLVGIAPAAKWATKSWPRAHFKTLASTLSERGYQIVLIGSPKDSPICQEIQSEVPKAINYCGATTFAHLGALIEKCDVFIANDSGPMHMARALGIPTLAFFGSTSPAQFDFNPHQVLFQDLKCSPCSLYGRKRCPYGHLNCLKNISVADALLAFEKLAQTQPGTLVCG